MLRGAPIGCIPKPLGTEGHPSTCGPEFASEDERLETYSICWGKMGLIELGVPPTCTTCSQTGYCPETKWETKAKHTTGGIPRWSPTLVLVARFSAYVWQSGRDAQFSLTYGRM